MNFDILRQKILEKAIRGELVPQLESEPEVVQISETQTNVPFTIPEKWKWVRVLDVAYLNPKVIVTNPNVDVSFIPMASVFPGYSNHILLKEKRPWNTVKNGYAKFNNGDVLIAKITPCFQNRKSAIANNLIHGIGCGSSEFHVLRANASIVDRKYLLIFVKSLWFVTYGVENFKGTAGQQRLGSLELTNCLFPLPPLSEQLRIIAKTKQLFDQIDQAEKAYNELSGPLSERFRQLCLEKAIQGKLVPQLESELCIELPDSQLSDSTIDIPKKWKWVKLKDIFTFIDYRGKTPNKIHEGVRLITASNVKQGRMDHSKKVFISNEEYLTRQSRGISKKGDILFTTEAPLGKVAIADIDNYSAGQRIITLQSKKGNNKLYMYFMLSPYFQKRLVSQATGTTAQGIKAARLKELVIPVPPEGEQERILNKLTALFSFLEIYK